MTRSTVFAFVAVALLLGLRAKSDGAPPNLAVIGLSLVAVAILAYPLTASERKLPLVFAGLVTTQLALHVGFLFASTGRVTHGGSVGFFCSPATAQAGPNCLPTERGGMLLLLVQLAAAAVFAWSMRSADSLAWQLARQFARNQAARLNGRLARLAGAIFSSVSAIAPTVIRAPLPAPPVKLHPATALVRACRRRGPPRRRPSSPSGFSFLAISPAPAVLSRSC